MRKFISITFTFDFSIRLSSFNLFDIGTDKDCFDNQKTIEDFTNQYNQTFKAQLNSIVTASKTGTPLSIYLSADFIQLLQEVDQYMLSGIKDAATAGNLELLGGLDRLNLSAVYSERQFVRSVVSHRDVMKSTFGVEPTTFYNIENIFFTRIGNILSENGFNKTFAGVIDWYLGSNLHERVFHLSTSEQFKVLLVDGDQTKALFHIPEIKQHFLQFNPTQIAALEGIESVISKTSAKGELVSIAKQMKDNSSSKSYNIKNPVMGSTHDLMLDSFNGNALQSQVLKQYYQLEEMLASDSKDTIKLWDKLGHSEYLHLMNVSETSDKQPYTIYNQLNNILTDLKLKLEN